MLVPVKDRLEVLKNDIEGVVEIANHRASKIGIELLQQVGALVLECASELKQSPNWVWQHCQLSIGRSERWVRYAVQTAKKYPNKKDLPLKGVRQFINEELEEEPKQKLVVCKRCQIHCNQ